jgi:hypothetical protein
LARGADDLAAEIRSLRSRLGVRLDAKAAQARSFVAAASSLLALWGKGIPARSEGARDDGPRSTVAPDGTPPGALVALGLLLGLRTLLSREAKEVE